VKIIGIDFGDARTGIAVSDPFNMLARGIGPIFSKNPSKTARQVANIVKQEGAELIVVGLPKNMDGSLGFRAEATTVFIELLQTNTIVPVITWDERLTTVSANRILDESNHRGNKRKQMVDTVSAILILQSYLDSLSK